MQNLELKKLKLLGIIPLEDIEEHQLDITTSSIYRSEDILVTIDKDLIVQSAYNLYIGKVKDETKADRVFLVKETLFSKLRDFVIAESARDVQIQSDSETMSDRNFELDKTEVSKILTNILNSAKNRNSSDVHILPKENTTEIKFRENGELKIAQIHPLHYAGFLVNKLKNEAKMDISNKLIPQDGSLTLNIEKEKLELRISTLPTVYGENAVIRLQRSENLGRKRLEGSGFRAEDLATYRDKFQESHGLILNVGGTGTGKSTTFGVTINELVEKFPFKNIVTAEDPVEMKNPNITQVEVNEKQGRTFATVLKALMRQDPDIVLIGEIRDAETAAIGAAAAQTGHLVLATLHANDSFEAISRLRAMGIKNDTISGIASCFLSQVLLKVLCPKCKRQYDLSKEEIQKNGLSFSKAYEPVGCAECDHTGFVGREAAIEVLPIDEEIKQAISDNLSPIEIKRIMRKREFSNIWDNALLKVEEGVTTLEEVKNKIKRDSVLNYKN